MTWILDHLDDIWYLTRQHAWLSAVPTVIGLLLSIPLGWLARRYRFLYSPVVVGTGLLYTIPSLALFILMPLFLGTRILDPVNVVVAMTLYTIALLTRTVADGLGSVPDSVTASATAMGFGALRRLFTIELPLAVPVIAAGLRVAVVSNVSIVSVAALIGVPQLGSLFTDGFYRDFLDPIVAGLIACVLLALAFDLVVVLVARWLTPWQRAGRGMNDVLQWLTDGANWQGSEGIPLRVWEHLKYSFVALAIAGVLAIPLGLWVGHTGRGRFLAVNLTGALRAVPSLGLLYLAIMLLGSHLHGDWGVYVPTIVVLVVLAVPPILAGAYAGVGQVEGAARDAARGMGMRGSEVLWQVEVPCALPLIVSGIRSAALQVIATATLAATVGLGGLGRFLIDGLSVRDYAQMAGGAILVAVLALLVDFAIAALQRVVVSPGLTGKDAGRKNARTTIQRTLRTSRS